MAISYPIQVPNHDFASFNMRLVRAVAMTESPFTFQQQVYEYDGAKWEMEITLPPLTYVEAREWEAFILSLRGMRGTFLMGNPLHDGPQGTATVVALREQGLIRSTTINVDGSTSGQTLKAGDYFQIGSGADSHIHQVVQDATFDGSGNATLEIEPGLRTTYANNTTLDFTLPKGVWRLASNDIGWSVDQASLHGFTIPCVEAL